jgi:DtxR family transcriptional regulator, Mn-dependent transcriptional regulator
LTNTVIRDKNLAMAKNARQDELTPAHEDYLRAIYLLIERGDKVSNSAIATQLRVAPASATNMVKRLADMGLVAHTPYHGVELTPEGEKLALGVVRYHRLLETYLARVLEIPWDEVHAEADRLEHVISAGLADALARATGDPTADPHGDPIPASDGRLLTPPMRRLSDQPPGRPAVLVRVAAQDAAALRELGQIGLYPGVALAVVGRADMDDALLVEVAGARRRLRRALAEQLFVAQGP